MHMLISEKTAIDRGGSWSGFKLNYSSVDSVAGPGERTASVDAAALPARSDHAASVQTNLTTYCTVQEDDSAMARREGPVMPLIWIIPEPSRPSKRRRWFREWVSARSTSVTVRRSLRAD